MTLQVARAGHSSIVLGNHLYVIGGANFDGIRSDIERATISDGLIGTFQTVPGLTLQAARWGHAMVQYRAAIGLFWLLALVLLIPPALRFDRMVATTESRVARSESNEVDERLATQFGARAGPSAVLVLSGVPSPASDNGRALLNEVILSSAGYPGRTRHIVPQHANNSGWRLAAPFSSRGLTAARDRTR